MASQQNRRSGPQPAPRRGVRAEGPGTASIGGGPVTLGRVPINRLGLIRLLNVRYSPNSGGKPDIAKGRSRADYVAKRFCSSERARLIQDQTPTRNADSKTHTTRIVCCVFLFYSFSAATFATNLATAELH